MSKNWHEYGTDEYLPVTDDLRLVVSTNRAQEEDEAGNDIEFFEHYVTGEIRVDGRWQFAMDIYDTGDSIDYGVGREEAFVYAEEYAEWMRRAQAVQADEAPGGMR